MLKKVYNFAPGPSVIPQEVKEQATHEFQNYANLGSSIVELSHRTEQVVDMTKNSISLVKELLLVPDDFEVLFMSSGARGQFAAVPLNILGDKQKACYLVQGYWSKAAAIEAGKYCQVQVLDENNLNEKSETDNSLLESLAYLHYCDNESMEGFENDSFAKVTDLPLVSDMTSSLFTKEIDFSNLDLVYAAAQKNFGIAGITLVIIRKNLLGKALAITPSVLNYSIQLERDSLYNTPAIFSWYVTNLYLEWIKQHGGISIMQENAQARAKLIYDVIDEDDFYQSVIEPAHRSRLNICFNMANSSIEQDFIKKAADHGLLYLKGHKAVGGIRASMYNAMPLEGAQALAQFMRDFREDNK